ncbi:MAG: serine hydrolase [Candidatus Andeanibacterium colombiense]|uniref:Serine hydrolase n=1 Tax=Candidatus Andeanibacterium colombiense TaxID=3121345 RepID=A0AAJ5X9A4_9SPHN|nr:MAG: serine hydrolase [Sphingomonadaceae bacterium]
MVRNSLAGVALAALVLTLASCSREAEQTPAPEASLAAEPKQDKTYPLTPAVIAMRWQLLNPEVESFTFRDTDHVFESRAVTRAGDVWELPRADGFAMPKDEFGGKSSDYKDFAERSFTNAMLVIKGGKIVFEDYRNRSDENTHFLSMSMAKTVTSLLMGIAVAEHDIRSLDDPAERYVPELKGTGYDGVTIRQLLQMRSGVDYNERYDFGAHPSFAGKLHEQAIVLNKMRFAAGALETKNKTKPGSNFNYSTLDTMVLGWVLEKATGDRLETFTRTHLWEPLGAEGDAFWIADGPPGTGRALNGMGFNATLRDYGRLGLLMLRNGKRGDADIVHKWMPEATTMLPTGAPKGKGFPGYGYQIWQVDDEPGAYAAVGLAGQYIYVSPKTDTVIVKLSYYPPKPPPTLEAETIAYFKAIAHTPVG